MLVLLVLSTLATAGFIVAERRAAEPILPLTLFRNRIFTVSSVIGFIVGVSLFGSVTYIPLYLQIVKGASPTQSGLEMLPLMGGVLLTSIGSGQLISRFGRYKVFPIVGTALMAVGMLLLRASTAGTSMVLADLVHVRGRTRARLRDASADPRRPECRRLSGPRSCDSQRDLVPLHGWNALACRSSVRSSPTSWPPSSRITFRPARPLRSPRDLGPGLHRGAPRRRPHRLHQRLCDLPASGLRARRTPRAHGVRLHLVAAGTSTSPDRGRSDIGDSFASPRTRHRSRSSRHASAPSSPREPLSHLQARRRSRRAATRAESNLAPAEAGRPTSLHRGGDRRPVGSPARHASSRC